jgi:ribosomal protein L31E
MKKVSNYQNAKKELKKVSDFVKKQYPKDKPLIRQSINDKSYFLGSEFMLSPYEIDLLSNYACTLHPKE